MVDRADAIAELAPAYAVALRLRDAGAGEDLIALALGVDPEAVPSVLGLADAKLATLMAEVIGPGPGLRTDD